MPEHPDLVRLRGEYSTRALKVGLADLYSLSNPAQLFSIQQRQRAIMNCLNRNGFSPLREKCVLEVGCGGGGVLLECLGLGVSRSFIHGTDLLLDRLLFAQKTIGELKITNADAQNLPYAGGSFDLVLQFTVFSSILDDKVKANLAKEMLRAAKPNGLILWYDFWLNPTNKHTHGIRPAEVRKLFPNCRFEFHKITLAPPIARRIVPISWIMALMLEKLKIFNSHYLVAIRPHRFDT